MKSFNAFAAASLLLAALALAAPGHAAEPGNKDDWIKGRLFGPEQILAHQSKLKLTDKQREKVGVELKKVQAQAAEVDWLLMNEASQLQELIEQHPVDVKAVLARIDHVFEAENRKKRLFMEMLINIKNMLTDEQIAYLKQVSAQP